MKAALYARYSTAHQRETSIADQLRLGRVRCASEGWGEPLEYSDAEISASVPIAKRPGGLAMLTAALAGDFQVLVIEALDRAFRDVVDQEQTLRRLEFLGIRIIGLVDGYDSAAEHREMYRGMRGLFNQQYLRDIAHKTHRGLSGQVQRGFHAGGLAYGYRSEADGERGHRLVIVPEQAEVVRQIFTLYADGCSVQRIAAHLNERRIPTARGGTWAVSALYGRADRGTGVLNNSLYVGRYVWNRAKFVKDPATHKRTRIDRPREEWLIAERPELRIIDDDLWQRAHQRMREPTREGGRGRGARPTTFFGGLLRCWRCGGAVVAISGRLYGCAARKDRGAVVCEGVFAPRQAVDQRLLSMVRERMLSPAAIAEAQAQFTAALKALRGQQATARAQVDRRRRELDVEILHLVDAITRMGHSDALATRLKLLEAERATLATPASAPDPARQVRAIEDAAARYKRQVMDLQAALADDMPRARELLRELLGEITLSQDGEGVFAAVGEQPAGNQLVAAGDVVYGSGCGDALFNQRLRII